MISDSYQDLVEWYLGCQGVTVVNVDLVVPLRPCVQFDAPAPESEGPRVRIHGRLATKLITRQVAEEEVHGNTNTRGNA